MIVERKTAAGKLSRYREIVTGLARRCYVLKFFWFSNPKSIPNFPTLAL